LQFHEILFNQIISARDAGCRFFDSLKTDVGYRYSLAHDERTYPSGLLYGTWSAILGRSLVSGIENISTDDRCLASRVILDSRLPDGSFWPTALAGVCTAKSTEYLKLHFSNYSIGALVEIDPLVDLASSYLDGFLDGNFLGRWLEGRSLARPWEEGNNLVNVASWLAWRHSRGLPGASNRLEQLLDWHRKVQNPETGGFDSFGKPSSNQRLQSMAGAVHNFHLHLFLDEKLGPVEAIATSVPSFLLGGRLTACLSIDFTELAIRTIEFAPDPQFTVDALVFHALTLLDSQRPDGGWLEAADDITPTVAAGFRDDRPASCGYATWFRLCSLGMIAVFLLGGDSSRWHFRRTLGMGYAPKKWPVLPNGVVVRHPPMGLRMRTLKMKARSLALSKMKRIGVRWLG